MDTLIAPVKQTVIQLPATQDEKDLNRMIQMVRDGDWCRNTRFTSSGRKCALGMIEFVAGVRDAYGRYTG